MKIGEKNSAYIIRADGTREDVKETNIINKGDKLVIKAAYTPMYTYTGTNTAFTLKDRG